MIMFSAASSLLRHPLKLNNATTSRFVRYLASSSSRCSPILLYQRANNRVAFPRAVLAMSSFNSVYWFWYTLDFIPSVNSSALDQIHIDTSLGYLGMAISMVLQTATLVYPQRLVSKILYDPTTQDLTVYNHDVPTIWASSFSHTYPLGAIKLDAGGADAKRLVNEQEWYRGALALKVGSNKMLPLLVDLQDDDDLPDAALFTQLLMTPEKLVHMAHSSSSSSNAATSNSNNKKKKRVNKKKSGTRVPSVKR